MRKQISKKIRFSILKKFKFKCFYCGVGPDKAELQIDHKVPVICGGSNDEDNLVCACLACNLGKIKNFNEYAELERELIRARIISGMERAKTNGTKLGRPQLQWDVEKAKKMQVEGVTVRAIADALKVSRMTIFRGLAQNNFMN